MFRKRFCASTALVCAIGLATPAIVQAAPFVHGTLRSDTGQPLASVVVTVYLDQLPDASQTAGVQLDKVATTATDANGNYAVSLVAPDAATKAEMEKHGGWANIDLFANGPGQQVTTGFSRNYDTSAGTWGADDGSPVTATTAAVEGQAVAQPAANLQPAGGGSHCTIIPVGDYWTTWNPIVRLHMGEHMSGSVEYHNDHNSSMQSEISSNEVAWGASTLMHLQTSSLDHSMPMSSAVSATIRANINNHRYDYLYCANYLEHKSDPVIWKGSLSKGARVPGLNCRSVNGAYRTPLSTKSYTLKTEGATQTIGYSLSSAPLTQMLNVGLSESTSWSKTITIKWKAEPHTQNYLCWKPPYSSVGNALEVFTSTAG